jgi:hypothetical protein
MTPLRRAPRDLAVNTAPLRAVFGMRLRAVVLLSVLIELADDLLTEVPTTAASMTKQSSFTLFFATKSTLALFFVLETPLLHGRWRVDAALLGSAAGFRQSRVSRSLLAVLLVVDEVPALREVGAEILYYWTRETQCYVGPAHARALRPVELVVLPVGDVLEV